MPRKVVTRSRERSPAGAGAPGEAVVRVVYPLREGTLALRTDADWDADVAPVGRAEDGASFEFRVNVEPGFRYFKPVVRRGAEVRWAQGENCLALADDARERVVHPHFDADSKCHECDVHQVPASFRDRVHSVRVWLPPGYDENELARYPVLYMQDGQNLFFADEAFGGEHWRVAETWKLLESMSLVRPVIVVGVYPVDRLRDYTEPGSAEYARFLADDLKPWVDAHYRTLAGPADTGVMGSSLGGVAALSVAWSRPDVFGKAACLSSTFGYADRLCERVASEPRRALEIYLDSGWPHDNFEVTRRMRNLLQRRGWREGLDLHYLAFPRDVHDEAHWAMRAHIPYQLLFGAETSGRAAHRSPRPEAS